MCDKRFIDARQKAYRKRLALKYQKCPPPPKPDCDVIPIRPTLFLRQLPNGMVYWEQDDLADKIDVAVVRHNRLVAQLNDLLVKIKQF